MRAKGYRIKRSVLVGGILLLVSLVLLAAAIMTRHSKDDARTLETPNETATEPKKAPNLSTEEVAGGYSNIWDIVQLDKDTIIFDERGGVLHGVNLNTKEKWQITTVPNVRAEGEGGLLGLALDNQYATNSYAYACYNAQGSKRLVKVTRFKLSKDGKSASEFTDIIPDIQSQAGRHSGCRLAMDRQNVLWVTTGDSAIGKAPQDPKSLAGKVLRVDREGKGVTGNMATPFDNRIYNYGHRNIQGLLLLREPLPNGAIGLTAEHGPDKEDEINWLKPGNFGWDPVGSRNAYNESVPMTDKAKYPDAIEAVWNSGSSTIAVSGMAFLTSSKWGLWQGWVAVATLKGQHVHLLRINNAGEVKAEEEVLKDFGRIRTVMETKNGELLLTTDNGNGSDKIIKVTPN